MILSQLGCPDITNATENNAADINNLPMQYTEIFSAEKMKISTEIFICFSYFCSKILGEAVLMCTHNLCFGAKIRKIHM